MAEAEWQDIGSLINWSDGMAGGLPCNGWPDLVRHGRDKHYYPARQGNALYNLFLSG